jgi:AcrR family transcriptional regulator
MSSDDNSFQPGVIPTQRPGKEGGVRARNRAERTRVLCETAVRLFLSQGLEATTVDEITKAAGVAKGSFYRYFSDKTQLVDAIFAPLSEAVAVAMKRCEEALRRSSTPAEMTRAYGALAAELSVVLLGSTQVVALYLQESRGPARGAREPIRRIAEQLTQGAVGLTEVAMERGLLEDLRPDVTAVAVVGAVEGMLVQYLQGRYQGEPAEAWSALIQMVLQGVAKR